MLKDFVTLIAFILAFFQFLKPINEFRLDLAGISQKVLLWILAFLGITAFAYILVQIYKFEIFNLIPSKFEHILHIVNKNFDLAWTTSVALLAFYLIYKTVTVSKFTIRNSGKYLSACHSIISSGNEENINILAREIGLKKENIKNIFDAAVQEKNIHLANIAKTLIALFSDELFCKAIVNHNPGILYNIFSNLIENPKYFKLTKQFSTRLIGFMFTEDNSILYREEPGQGLGQLYGIKDLIFSNYDFLVSGYEPLSSWLINSSEKINSLVIKKYFEVIGISLICYLEKKTDLKPEIIFIALKEVADLLISKKDNEIKMVKSCLMSLLELINDENFKNILPNSSNIITEESLSKICTIYDAFALALYKIIEAFSKVKDYEAIKWLLIKIYLLELDSKVFKLIAERLDLKLIKKIKENLTQHYYPAVTAGIIYSFGLCEPEESNIPIHKLALELLKKEFIKFYQSRPKIAQDMLPDGVSYDEENDLLIRKGPLYFRHKNIEKLTLNF